MRASADPADPGYATFERAMRDYSYIRVYLDGTLLDANVVEMADDEAGEVVCLKRNARNEFYLDPVTNEIARTTFTGRVVIEFTDRP